MPRIAPLSELERAAFVAAARAHVAAGTRFRHQGRGPTHLDCVGLIVVALAAVGRASETPANYGREPAHDRLRDRLREHFGPPVAAGADGHAAAQPGDVVAMAWHLRPQHVAIVGDHVTGGLSLIHADALFGAVVEHAFIAPWLTLTIEVYRP